MPEAPSQAGEGIQAILRRWPREPRVLLQVLVEVQEALHAVPEPAVDAITAHLGVRRAEVRGLVGFHDYLSSAWLGERVIHLGDAVTDHLAGGRELAGQLCRRLGVVPGEVRPDGRVSVHLASCTGMADQPPAALVDGRPVTRLTPARVDLLADLVEGRIPMDQWPEGLFQVEDPVRRSDVLYRRAPEPGAALRAVLQRPGTPPLHPEEALDPASGTAWRLGAEAILQELRRSGLRGRGGAGFPTARKWEACRAAAAGDRWVVCNADEGEPGTFKDRSLLTRQADLVVEGMTLCALAIGAARGILFVRREYRYLKDHLEAVLARRRAGGLLGPDLLGTGHGFDLDLHWGAGGYICGMESALLESIEGRRGHPRRRWPLPVVCGLEGRPTVVNNVETFAAAALVALKGGAWFAGHGTPHSTGTKLFCLSGDCERPGLYEYPFGVSVREVLRDAGGLGAQAVQVGGPSGTLILPPEFDRTLAFEDLGTAGSLLVFGPHRDLLDAVRTFCHFFRRESCGLCTPCRVGSHLLAELMDRVASGQVGPLDLAQALRLARLMKRSSHCGLGQSAPNPVLDSLARVREGWERGMAVQGFEPAFDLEAALAQGGGTP